MNQSRLDQLFELYKQEPDDPFIIYAIALEYKKSNPDEALPYFTKLIQKHPEYLAAYYHAAENYLKTEQNEEARKVLEKGIKVAEEQKNFHTLQELNSLFEEFFGEEDDF